MECVTRATIIVLAAAGCLAGCAALGGLATKMDWQDASNLCDKNPQACKDKCSAGSNSTCDYILVQNIEEHPEQFAGAVVDVRNKLQPYCAAGLERACAAVSKVATLNLEGNEDAQTESRGPNGTAKGANSKAGSRAEAKEQAAEAKRKVNGMLASLPSGEAGTNNIAIRLAGCQSAPKECVEAAEAVESKLARLSGLALYFARLAESTSSAEDAAKADQLADEALAEAKRLVSGREQKAAQLKTEAALVTKARSDCNANPAACRQKCDADEYPMCVAAAIQLSQSRKFAEARTALQKACNGGFETACANMTDLAKAEAATAERLESAWSRAASAADDITQRRHMAAFARQHAPTAQNLAAAQRVDADVAMLVRDSYCPAVRDFLERSTRADFQARAKEHCDQNPPTGSALGGEEVVLTAGCRQVFATPCAGP